MCLRYDASPSHHDCFPSVLHCSQLYLSMHVWDGVLISDSSSFLIHYYFRPSIGCLAGLFTLLCVALPLFDSPLYPPRRLFFVCPFHQHHPVSHHLISRLDFGKIYEAFLLPSILVRFAPVAWSRRVVQCSLRMLAFFTFYTLSGRGTYA